MRLTTQKAITWISTVLLGYFAIFYWIDASMKLLQPSPWTIPWPVVLTTVLVSMRGLFDQSRFSLRLTSAALLGMLIDRLPLLFPLALMVLALVWLFAGRSHGHQSVIIGHRPLWRWPVRLNTNDRFLHMHVLGPTGSGKSSSVLMPLITQDLSFSHGLTIMEPKGDLARCAYRAALRHGRSVIWFDPAEPACSHYNPLSGPAESAAEGLVWALNQISAGGHPYYAASARVQLLYAVRAVKYSSDQFSDIGTILQFLRDESFQRKLVNQSPDQALQQYFQEQWSRKAGQSREDRQGLINRLELFWANPDVRRVLSSPQDFTWDQVLEEGWIVLCPLSLARLGDSAKALGSLLWHGLAQATYRRSPGRTNAPYFLYLDEFHQWVSEDLSDFLALARGYSMGLILAHQDMGQLSKPLREALMANARQRIILAGSTPDDIALFARAAEPHMPNISIRYLKRGYAFLHFTHKGRLQRPQVIRLAYESLQDEVSHGV